MHAIGGYFELADYEEGKGFPHQKGILLNTGRNALEYILRSIGEVKRIYLPYFTCEVVLEPIDKLHIPYTYYHINQQFEISDDIQPKEGEYIIANNYFGIKDAYIQQLARQYGDHLIVDCAQAFFAKPIPGINCYYSPRKFVGVADGGVAYLGIKQDNMVVVNEVECTVDHDSHLYKRKEFGAEAGFAEYQTNETKLDNQPIRWMSNTTKKILNHIDYDKIIAKRRENYGFLHETLSEKNVLALPEKGSFECPMVYPFVSRINRNFRHDLIAQKVFVAKYWPNVYPLSYFQLEFDLANKIIPITCDQRYGRNEMNKIITFLEQK